MNFKVSQLKSLTAGEVAVDDLIYVIDSNPTDGSVKSKKVTVGDLIDSRIYGISSSQFVLITGYYADPSWITSLDWSKITNAPSFVTSLSALTDVQLSTPLSGQALVYNGTKWVNQGIGELDTLNSVTTRGNTTTNNITVGTLYFGNASHYLVTDNSTYAMLSSNRTLQLSTSGNPVLSVFTTQNVAIGTTTDSGFKLDVNGSTRVSGSMTVNNRYLYHQGNSAIQYFMTSNAWSGTNSIFFGDDSSSTIGAITYNHQFDSLAFTVNGTNALHINSSRNIGIGTTSPTNAVHIRTAAGGATSNYALVWQESTGDRVLGYLGADNSAFFSGALYLYQNGVSNTKITANGTSYLMGGNVLVGTTTDAGYKLDVNGTGRYQGALTVYDNFNILRSTLLTDVFNIYSSTNSGITTPGRGQFIVTHGGREIMRAYADRTTFANGVVQIGTNTTPVAQLQVTGSITAASLLAQGVYFNNTLVAAANNDVLVGLDINPTFTNGAFTGVANASLRASGWMWSNIGFSIGSNGMSWDTSTGPVNGFTLDRSGVYGRFRMGSGSGFGYQFFTNSTERLRIVDGNVMVLNTNMLVGTTTDSGFKLDVNGTARFSNDIRVSTSSGATIFLGIDVNNTVRVTDTYAKFQIQRTGIGGLISINGGSEAGTSYNLGNTGHAFTLSNNNTTADTFTITRPFFGNVVATTKTIINITTTNASTLSNATLLRGIYFNPTVTDWASIRAIETTSGNVIFNGGNVGIGTSSPTNPLTIAKSGSNNYFNFEPSATGTAPFIQAFYQGAIDARLYFGNNLQLRNSGSTLLYGLDCGTINASGSIVLGGTSDQRIHLFGSTNNFVQFSDAGVTHIGVIGTADATNYIQVRTGAAANMSDGTLSTVFFNSGNVGINTTTDAGYKLDVNGNVRIVSSLRTDTFGTDNNATIGGPLGLNSSIIVLNKAQTTYIPLATRNTTGSEVVYDLSNIGSISATGNVGIGTTSPTGRNGYGGGTLVELVDNAAYASFNLNGGNISSPTYFTLGAQGAGADIRVNNKPLRILVNSIDVLTIPTTGNVLINTTTDAGYKLQVQGSGYFNTNTASTNSILKLTDNSNGTAWLGISSVVTTGFFIGSNGTMTLGKITGGDNSSPSTSYSTITLNQNGVSSIQLATNVANTGIVFSDGVNGTIRMNFPAVSEAAITTISSHNLSIGVASSTGSLSSTTMKFFQSTNNVAIGTTTDGGYKLNVTGNNYNTFVTNAPFLVDTSANNYRIANLINNPNYHSGGFTNNTFDIFSVGANTTSSAPGNGNPFFRVNIGGGSSTGYYGAAGQNQVLAQLNAVTTSTFVASAQGGGIAVIGSTGTATVTTISAGTNLNLRSDVNGSYAGGGINYFASINGSQHSHVWYFNSAEQMRLMYTGNLLLGTATDSGYRLDVNGTARFKGFTTVSATTLVNGDAALTIQSTTNNSVVGQLYGINNIVTASTNVSNISGINSAVNTSSSASLMAAVQGQVNISANTLTEAKGFTTNPAATGTGTFTRYIGFDNLAVFTAGSGSVGTQIFLRSQYLNAAANNIGLLLQDAAAATVTGNWAIHDQTGYSSYFKGNIGIGTTTPVSKLNVYGGDIISSSSTANRTTKLNDTGLYLSRTSDGVYTSSITADGAMFFNTRNSYVFNNDGTATITFQSDTRNVLIGASVADLARLTVKGSGSTSATSSLLIQNSSGTQLFKLSDDGTINTSYSAPLNCNFALNVTYDISCRTIYGNSGALTLNGASGGNATATMVNVSYYGSPASGNIGTSLKISSAVLQGAVHIGLNFNGDYTTSLGSNTLIGYNFAPINYGTATLRAFQSAVGGVYVNTTSYQASAILQADSTTQGFLAPRMTTAQINAITSPAEGLQVYNTDLHVICFYDGTAWKKVSHSNM